MITVRHWTLTELDHTSTVDTEGEREVCKPGICPSCIVLRESEAMKGRKSPKISTKTQISFQVFFLLNTKAFNNFNKNRGNILKRSQRKSENKLSVCSPLPPKKFDVVCDTDKYRI
jgi:hypothetical protein